jgi:hypothetical protein
MVVVRDFVTLMLDEELFGVGSLVSSGRHWVQHAAFGLIRA